MNNISKVLQKLIYKEKRKQYLVFLEKFKKFFQQFILIGVKGYMQGRKKTEENVILLHNFRHGLLTFLERQLVFMDMSCLAL